jgi:CRP-like cAMP-binding protein
MELPQKAAGALINRIVKGGMVPQKMEFTTGQIIHDQDEPALTFYVIESGEVRLFYTAEDGTTRLLSILGPGEWIGSAALGQLPTYGKRAVTAAQTVVWALSAHELHHQLRVHGELAVQLLEDMSRQLQQAWEEGSQLMFQDCRLRLIRTLLRFSTSPAAKPSGDEIVLHITHAQLAQAVGAARETVSVCLTELRQANLVHTGRNRLTFNPQRLRELERGGKACPK